MALFALDHNYPAPIIGVAATYLKDVELAFLDEIDPRLPNMDDWELLLALHHHKRPWDGLISNDTGMLTQPRELAVLGYTRLSLVAPQAAGHDPIRSTGLVLAHIEDIAARTTRKRPQIWKLSRRTQPGDHPDRWLERLAERQGVDSTRLRRVSMPVSSVLEQDPLS